MPASSTYLYVGNGETRNVSAFRLDQENGDLAPIGTFEVPGPAQSCFSFPLAVSPDKRILFVVLRNEPWSVRSFAIDAASGRLDYLGFGPLADNTCYISTDRTGRFLLSASYQGNKIAVNPIGADGIVQAPQQIIDTKPKSHSILVDAANRYALSACLGDGIFYQWRFNAETGRLTPNEPPFVSGEETFRAAPFRVPSNGRMVYLLNEHAVTIYVYDYDPAKGTLPSGRWSKCSDTEPWRQDLGDRHPHHSRRQVPLCRRTWIEHTGDVESRSRGRRSLAHRAHRDREAAARLRHRSDRPISLLHRPAVDPHVELCDRRRQRKPHQAQ
jgi:6-phosphogluconolactonase